MTSAEFKKELKTTGNFKVFNKLELKLNFEKADVKRELIGLIDIHDFFSSQKKAWEEDSARSIETEFRDSPVRFDTYLKDVETFVKNFGDADEEQRLINQWQNESVKISSQIIHAWPHDCPRVLFLKQVHNNYGSAVMTAAMRYFKREAVGNGINDWLGFQKAYEFDHAEESMFAQRKELEKSSFSSLRTSARASQTKLTKEIADIINVAETSIQNKETDFDEMQNLKAESYDQWFTSKSEESEIFFKEAKSRRDELEKVYEEKLSYEKPVEYWRKRARKMNKEGWIAMTILVALVTIMVVILSKLLFASPEGLFVSIFDKDASAIKWTIAYITLISFLAFVMKVISKFAFSSFHLSRDAQEREQLTYVYLALKNEPNNQLGKEDRSLILQSLFSRADSGLLKEDSSPTMPGLMERMINR